MKFLNRNIKVLLLAILVVFSGFKNELPENNDLIKGFRDPGREAKPRAYWNWLNGDVSKPGLTRDLEEAKAKGLGGLLMWDTEAMKNPGGFVPAGPPFMGTESVGFIQHSIKEAKRLNLDLGLVCASGWNSGGSWVTPEMAGKNLFSADIIITGPGQVQKKLPFPEVPRNCPKGEDGMPKWYIDVAVLAWPESKDRIIPDPSLIVDLTGRCKNNELVWKVPTGNWRVVRFVCSNNGQQLIAASPNSKGLFIDFLDPEATRFHFNYILNKLGIPKGGDPGSSLRSLDDDSMELFEGIQWTTKFCEGFQQYNGYDPVPWLPVLLGWTIKDETLSRRFQYDYNKTVSDLLILSHYTTGSEVCAEYGIELTAEAGGPGPPFWESCPVDALKALGNVGIPRGEFWLGNPRNLFLVKEIASAAHIYGKTYVDAESFTTWRRWRDGPYTLKQLVDRAFCEGLNRITYHGFANSPPEFGYPGRAYHAGLDMNPRITWWSKARPFMDYLARCSYLLQQGRFVADVAVYYGDQAPNFWPLYHNVPEKPVIGGLSRGYEYDVVNTDVILNRMAVKDGRIVFPDGMSYRILVLPEKYEMPLEVLEKLEKLVSAGATLLGPRPADVPGLGNFEKKTSDLRLLAGKMWGKCDGRSIKMNRYGRGRVVWGYTPDEWLASETVLPDFTCTTHEGADGLDFIHRQTPQADIYFVRNKTKALIKTDGLFRIKNRSPQIWDPTDGSMKKQYVYKSNGERTTLPLTLPAGGSVFVLFDSSPVTDAITSLVYKDEKGSNSLTVEQVHEVKGKIATVQCWQNGTYLLTSRNGISNEIRVNDLPEPLSLDGNWTVTFEPGRGAPGEIRLSELISWSDHANEGVRYFSGTGTYTRTFDVSPDWLSPQHAVYIDLGDVREVAEVYVNGKSAGVLWHPPFRADLTALLKAGRNELKIEVVNLWINRLSGDMKLPENERYTKSNIQSDGATPKVPAEPWHVQPSGLLGPVRLLPSALVSLKIQD